MCGPSSSPPARVPVCGPSSLPRYQFKEAARDRDGAEMEAFDHVATNDDTNRQVGRLNYFPLCRAVQVAFKTAVSRGREGTAAAVTQNAFPSLPPYLRHSL